MPRDVQDPPAIPRAATRTPLQHWLIFTGLSAFGFVLLGWFGLLSRMVAADRTHISSVIVLLYAGTALHCLWRTIAISREDHAARAAGRAVTGGEDRWDALPPGCVADHIRDLTLKAQAQGARRVDQALLLRVLAVRLRGSNGFGAFASDTLMKLGLVGTIVGFILMLAPIAGLDPGDRGAVRASMGLMSEGMAVAMYTTLAGLVASILVRVQYYMLDEATGRLFAFAVRLTELHVVPELERRSNFPANFPADFPG